MTSSSPPRGAAPRRRPWTRLPPAALVILLPAAVAILLPACSPEWGGSRVERDGVIYVRNPATPMQPPEILEMRELWRLPSETAEGELVFGAIADLQQDGAGNLYLLDTQLKTVHLISPDGEYVRALGRPGEGPGEFQWPIGLVLSHTRSEIGILDAVGHKIVFLTREGLPRAEWRAAGLDKGVRFSPLFAWEVPQGMLVAYQTRERQEREVMLGDAIGFFGEDHTRHHVLAQKSRTHPLDETFVFDEIVAESYSFLGVRPDGTVYLAPQFDAYRIEVYGRDGTLEMVIERECEPISRSAEQIADLRASWEAFYERVRDLELRIAETRRAILALRPRDDGTLWVETSRGWVAHPDEDIAVAFDLIDAEGRYVRQIALRGEIDPWNDYLYIFGDRLIRLTAGFEATQGALGVAGTADEEGATELTVPAAVCYLLVTAPAR